MPWRPNPVPAKPLAALVRELDADHQWGAPVSVTSTTLSRPVRELEAELVALATDMYRGPLARILAEATTYLGEVRREFLRVHRRLVVGARTDDAEHALDTFRTELAELNERLRAVVLGRASRMSTEGWRPGELMSALERTLEILPVRAEAELEPMSLQPNKSDPLYLAVARGFVRGWVRLRRALGGHPRRAVPLQALARFHLSGMPVERIEGVAAMFLQAEAQLVGHSRLILDGIARGLDTVREHATAADLQDVLATFKQQVEEEFSLAEGEIQRLVEDGGLRVVRVLGEGLRGLKADLPIAGTFELPSRKRRSERAMSAQPLALADLERRLQRARQSIAASYVLLGMHLEYASYRAKVRVVLGRKLSELRKDVRGRSHTQIERVLSALQEVLDTMKAPDPEEGEASEAPAEKEDLRSCLDPLERVLTEALRNANQLLEQLSEEQLVAPLLDALVREAQGLTDRYEVPAGRLPNAEWRLPPPLATVEVRLAELLTAYIQTEVAPELLSVTQAAASGIQPVVSAFHDLERVVGIDTEQFAELGPGGDEAGPADQRDVLRAALKRSHAALEAALAQSESWPDQLVEQLKQVVFRSVDSLRESLSEARVGELKGSRRGPSASAPRALTRQVDRLTGFIDRLGEDSTRSVRRLVGERRLAQLRRQLGLPDTSVEDEDLSARLAAPTPASDLPLFYRRLFAGNAYWGGDLLPEQRRAVERVKDTLAPVRGRALRSAAVLSVDGAGQGALLAAISRGDRLAQVRRINFSRPVEVDEVQALFVEVGRGQLIVVGGFHWLMSAKPGGFLPVRAFLAGVLADNGNNAWLVEASTMVWRFAEKIAPVADVFGERIEVGALGPDDLESTLRARHQLSGMKAHFGPAPDDEGAEAAARDRYFAALHDVSGGHLSQALPAWVASIESVDEDAGVVRLGPPPPPARPALERLDEETCVILYAVARQGWMDAETLAYLFRWTSVGARGRLMRLVADGLLEQKAGGLYQIRRHLRHGVQDVLRDRGWCA